MIEFLIDWVIVIVTMIVLSFGTMIIFSIGCHIEKRFGEIASIVYIFAIFSLILTTIITFSNT